MGGSRKRSGESQQREGGVEVRNFVQSFAISPFPANSPQLFFACPPCVLVGARCVLFAEVLLLKASHGLAPQFFHHFGQFFAIGFDAP